MPLVTRHQYRVPTTWSDQAMYWGLSLALLAALPSVHAEETVLTLSTGETVRGQITDEDGQSIELHILEHTEHGVIGHNARFERSQVSTITNQLSIGDLYAQKAAQAAPTAAGQYELARWCHTHQLTDEAYLHAKNALTDDPHHAGAVQLMFTLGYTLVAGEWLNEDDRLARVGLVRVGQTIMTRAAATAQQALIAAQADRERLAKQLAGLDATLTELEHELNRAERLVTSLGNQDVANQLVTDLTAAASPLKTELVTLSQRRDDAITLVQHDSDLLGAPTPASSQALQRAQLAYQTGKRSYQQAQAALDEAIASANDHQRSLDDAAAAVDSLKGRRDITATAVGTATVALATARRLAARLQPEYDRLLAQPLPEPP